MHSVDSLQHSHQHTAFTRQPTTQSPAHWLHLSQQPTTVVNRLPSLESIAYNSHQLPQSINDKLYIIFQPRGIVNQLHIMSDDRKRYIENILYANMPDELMSFAYPA